MAFYQFADISHHKGEVDIQVFASAGHRIVISKASDNYHLPDKNGQYDFPAERHFDARFVDNFTNTRAAGLIAGAYHFCRFDRPRPVNNRAAIVQANLTYFQTAIAMLPPEYQDTVQTAILDMEQSGSQLEAASLNQATVSDMAKDIVTLFLENYENVILYSGSWWSDRWLTTAATEWMAERVGVWEPEYITLIGNNPWNKNFKPSVPRGFSNEYAPTADDYIGKMFAWQYTSKGSFTGINSAVDLNQTSLPKEELFKLFHQDGAVDPPPTEPPTDGEEKSEILEAIAALDAKVGALMIQVSQNQATDDEILALVRQINTKLDNG
ncbi:MAG: GH25 family lysozyme [Anaerolineales bacterium]|jgi:GH25 family lysozyme M1 (1,4-beta-N-acetylmuramidase)